VIAADGQARYRTDGNPRRRAPRLLARRSDDAVFSDSAAVIEGARRDQTPPPKLFRVYLAVVE
jgi:hypothetical protein